MLSNVGQGIHVALVTSQAGDILTWNVGCEALFGCTAAAAIGQPLSALLVEPNRNAITAHMSLLPTACNAFNVKVLRENGSMCAAELLLTPTFDGDGAPAGNVAFFSTGPDDANGAVVGRMPLASVIDTLAGTFYMIRRDGTCHGRHYLCAMGLDISGQRAQDQRLRLCERALHAASNGLVITRCAGADNPVEYANPAFERITGYSAAEIIGRDPRFMAAPGLDSSERERLRQAMRERREVNVVFRNRRKNGEIFWNDLTVTPVDDGHAKVSHCIGVITDVTAAMQRTAHLEHEVNHDPLTGLANRTLLWDRLEQAIHLAQRNKSLVATVLIDLNGFKQINDTLGHEAGDAVLTVMARRLQALVRESDTVARLSGDEFVLVLVNQLSLRFTLRMVERLRAGMSRQASVNGVDIAVGASMGVSVYPHDGANAKELIRAADTAMYHAKAAKKMRCIFSADMKLAAEAKQKLERDLHLALEREELFLLYQPKMCLRSGRIKGVEALLRWRHPELGVLLPGAFLPDAEENGIIVSIGNFVLDQACALMRRMQQQRMPVLPVAINVSYREFSRHHFTEHVAEFLARCAIAPVCLEFELRESVLNANHQLGLEVLSQLRSLGVQCAVDAFGDGLSDLRYLQQLPLTHLKIARSAVHQIGVGNKGAVAKALIDVAHDLGVATRQQRDFLKASNCDELQGAFVSAPLTEAALYASLAASPSA